MQFGVDSLTGLVAVEEIVAKRFDLLVEGDGNVGTGIASQKSRQGTEQPPCAADFATVGRRCRRGAIKGAVELVGSVDEMNLHALRVEWDGAIG